MPAVDLKLIFAVLGALCVVLGGLNGGRARRLAWPGRTWRLGFSFGAVAAWMAWMTPGRV